MEIIPPIDVHTIIDVFPVFLSLETTPRQKKCKFYTQGQAKYKHETSNPLSTKLYKALNLQQLNPKKLNFSKIKHN